MLTERFPILLFPVKRGTVDALEENILDLLSRHRSGHKVYHLSFFHSPSMFISIYLSVYLSLSYIYINIYICMSLSQFLYLSVSLFAFLYPDVPPLSTSPS